MALAISFLSQSSVAQPTAALTQALQDFDRSLTAAQKKQFGRSCIQPDASSVLTFVAQIDGQNNGRARRCFAPRLCSFLESTEQFVGVVETFVSSNPTIAALVWGGVKTAILAASNVASYFEKVTNMIMIIGKSCPTLQKFGLLYPTSVELQTALCEYYAIVIRLCAKIIEVSQRSNMLQTLSSVFQPFEAEFKPFRDDLDNATTSIQSQITLASNQAAREERRLSEMERKKNAAHRQSVLGFQKKSREEQAQAKEWRIAATQRRTSQMRSEILTNLTIISHTKPWKQASRQRLPGTAEWFKKDPAFLDWISAQGSSVLWCPGNLGTGKTVLAANVVAHLFTHRKPTDIIAYCFCRTNISESCQARQILGSIAAQMLESQVRMLDNHVLSKTYQESQDLDTTDLADFLCARLLPNITYYVVLDGLDECENVEVDMIANAVGTLRTTHAREIKLVCVSRPQLERQLFKNKKPTHEMRLSRKNVEWDIQKYIELTLDECLEENKLKLVDPRLVLEIKPALEDGADGM
jgi:Skp family chaperone for outer membrane proteins